MRKVELAAAEVEDGGPVFGFAHESRVNDILHLALVTADPPLEHAHLAEDLQVIDRHAR